MPNTTIPEIGAELLILRDLAALCGASQRTVWSWARSGAAPPPLRIGKGTVRYSRRAYERWIAAGCPRIDGGHTDE
jgi:predicted DNA-binding transcriptional regulator AlpA